ncbi:hypothetical protein BK816_07710 [Boudabousia tangfeifanii]|uniref:DUF218 domain-containing protein n=1 Tax=Boudabousia tangfeifanii TaxID=1912795 RepID=A0A1D9MLP1_9ACTO|nr:YdcF family protein [Boudabousia tangfeifanii]AOZ73195.1 hypothetical protein BK816_07710 [Boudabousia tangfeifanii]
MYFLPLIALALLVPAAVLATIWLVEPRSILLGFAIEALAFAVLVVSAVMAFRIGDRLEGMEVWYTLFTIFGVIVILALTIFPIFLYFFVFANGFKVIAKEGFSLAHALAVGSCLAIAFWWIFMPRISHLVRGTNWVYLVTYVNLLLFYLAFVASGFFFAAMANLWHWRKKNQDYLVVLGAGLAGDRVTPLLASRIRRGVKLAERSPSAKLVMSGGQGPDELLPEAVAMANYAVEELGFPQDRILIEDRSVNTDQNLQFSQRIIFQDWEKADLRAPRIAVVTNSYHVFRALLVARAHRVKCVGYGAKTKIYFSINAFIREFIGYLYMSRRTHAIILGVCTLLYLAGVIISVTTLGGIEA